MELKRQEMEYEKRRAHLISYYESVKHAQSVQVDDIPLPTLQVSSILFSLFLSHVRRHFHGAGLPYRYTLHMLILSTWFL